MFFFQNWMSGKSQIRTELQRYQRQKDRMNGIDEPEMVEYSKMIGELLFNGFQFYAIGHIILSYGKNKIGYILYDELSSRNWIHLWNLKNWIY